MILYIEDGDLELNQRSCKYLRKYGDFFFYDYFFRYIILVYNIYILGKLFFVIKLNKFVFKGIRV